MPCTKCKNNKYKWGKTGECKYDSKEACEKANNKKYNKMRPTPLGKTYEQYEKELKEYKEINLSKVEKVELGAIDDLNKFGKQFNSALSEIREAGDAANKWNEKVEKVSKIVLKLFPKINDLEDKITSQIKGLGLDVKDVPSLKDARESLDNFYTYRKRYNF